MRPELQAEGAEVTSFCRHWVKKGRDPPQDRVGMGRSWFRKLRAHSGKQKWGDHEQNMPGAAGRQRVEEGAVVPPRGTGLMCLLANQGRTQSPRDPQGLRQMGF